MLSRLSIRDIVLIERLDIDFAAGLSALTGETGAGKSILLDAFALALGSRGDASLVRHGAEQGQAAPPERRAEPSTKNRHESYMLAQGSPERRPPDGFPYVRPRAERTLSGGSRRKECVKKRPLLPGSYREGVTAAQDAGDVGRYAGRQGVRRLLLIVPSGRRQTC